MNADQLLHAYRELKATPSGNEHYKKHVRLQVDVITNQDAWLEAIFSGEITEDVQLLEMIHFGGRGNLGAEHNTHWHEFMRRVRERQDELPYYNRLDLQWLEDVHGW